MNKRSIITLITPQKPFVGYGIDLFGGPTLVHALIKTGGHFKDEVYDEITRSVKNTYIASDPPMNAMDRKDTVSGELGGVYSGMKINAGVDDSISWLSGDVESQYGDRRKLKSGAMFYNSVFLYITKIQSLDMIYRIDTDKLRDLVKECVLELINGSVKPKDVFRTLGTHIITSCGIGGASYVSGLYNSNTAATREEIKETFGAKILERSASSGAGLNDKQKAIANETKVWLNTTGGKGILIGMVPIDGVGKILQEWSKTIDKNETLADIREAIPIWELANDNTRKGELRNGFYERAEERNTELSVYFEKGKAREAEPILDGKTYYIVNNFSDDKAITINNMGRLHIYDWRPNEENGTQRWRASSCMEPLPFGWFHLVNANTGCCMYVDYNGSGAAQVKDNVYGHLPKKVNQLWHQSQIDSLLKPRTKEEGEELLQMVYFITQQQQISQPYLMQPPLPQYLQLFRAENNGDGSANLYVKSVLLIYPNVVELSDEQLFVYGSSHPNGKHIYCAARNEDGRSEYYRKKKSVLDEKIAKLSSDSGVPDSDKEQERKSLELQKDELDKEENMYREEAIAVMNLMNENPEGAKWRLVEVK